MSKSHPESRVDADLRSAAEWRRVHDVYGREYRVGPSDQKLLGRPRGSVAAAAWLLMLSVSATQYGYGVFAPQLMREHGWGLRPVLWGFAVWIICQAAASGGLHWLRRRVLPAPGEAAIAGSVCCALGLVALGTVHNPVAALAAFGVVCGVGAGLVYGTCVTVVAAWYPDRPARTAAVSGAFCYGAVPLALAAPLARTPELPLLIAAFVILEAAAVCAPLLRLPPPGWWPSHVDPRRWAVDRARNPALCGDRRPVRLRPTSELRRLPVAWAMAALVACVSAVALFDTSCLALFAAANGWPAMDGAAAAAAFAVGSGATRALGVRLAGRVGRRRAIAWALCAGSVAQMVLIGTGTHHLPPVFWLAACCAGAAAGTWYALLPGLVSSHFGDQPRLPNLWALYSAKALGGVLGVGCAALVVAAHGYPAALVCGAGLFLAGALLLPLLRRTGLLRTLPDTRAAGVLR